MPLLLQLYWEFFKTGLFAVGGGLATLPFLYDIADKTGWFTQQDIANLIAISESTPGPIGVNAATYVGYLTSGFAGGLVATLGLITPSILIILLVSRVLDRFADHPLVSRGFYGLRPASMGLIAAAGMLVLQSVVMVPEFGLPISIKNIVLVVVLWFAMQRWNKLHPVVFLGISAVLGIAIGYLQAGF